MESSNRVVIGLLLIFSICCFGLQAQQVAHKSSFIIYNVTDQGIVTHSSQDPQEFQNFFQFAPIPVVPFEISQIRPKPRPTVTPPSPTSQQLPEIPPPPEKPPVLPTISSTRTVPRSTTTKTTTTTPKPATSSYTSSRPPKRLVQYKYKAPKQGLLQEIVEKDLDGSYTLYFEDDNGSTRTERGYFKPTETGERIHVKEGNFRFITPEGIPYETAYIADELGYRILESRVGV